MRVLLTIVVLCAWFGSNDAWNLLNLFRPNKQNATENARQDPRESAWINVTVIGDVENFEHYYTVGVFEPDEPNEHVTFDFYYPDDVCTKIEDSLY